MVKIILFLKVTQLDLELRPIWHSLPASKLVLMAPYYNLPGGLSPIPVYLALSR